MPHYTGPLLTRPVLDTLQAALKKGAGQAQASFDLGLSEDVVDVGSDGWQWRGQAFPWPDKLKDRTIHYWDGEAFAPASSATSTRRTELDEFREPTTMTRSESRAICLTAD